MSEWTALDAELLDISVSRSRSAPADLEDVLVGLLVVHGPGETVADVEAGFRRLAGAGLLELDERRVSATVAGAELCATVKNPRGIPRLIRLHKALADVPVASAKSPPSIASTWTAARARYEDHTAGSANDRLEIVEGLLKALKLMDLINHTVAAASDRAAAVNALMKPRFGFTIAQANHILDMPVASQTQDAQEALAGERAQLIARPQR